MPMRCQFPGHVRRNITAERPLLERTRKSLKPSVRTVQIADAFLFLLKCCPLRLALARVIAVEAFRVIPHEASNNPPVCPPAVHFTSLIVYAIAFDRIGNVINIRAVKVALALSELGQFKSLLSERLQVARAIGLSFASAFLLPCGDLFAQIFGPNIQRGLRPHGSVALESKWICPTCARIGFDDC